jgi:hypothetical protein
MAVSPKMLALIQKIEAADAKHFAGLRASAKRDKEAKASALQMANAKKQSPEKKPPHRAK